LVLAATFCLVAPVAGSAQGSRRMPTPKYTKLLEVDSIEIHAPSLSPDGRWIVFAGARQHSLSRRIWIIPAAGGTPTALTGGGDYSDEAPIWEGNDRIVFPSSRVDGALVTMAIDPATGRAVGTPRRLTLERVRGGYSASPDGRFVVYSTQDSRSGALLRILPSSGGTARTLDSTSQGVFFSPGFTADGRFIEYVHGTSTADFVQSMRRIPAAGGNPIQLVRGKPRVPIHAGHGMVIDAARPDTATLRNTAGDTVAVFTVPNMLRRNGFAQFTSNPAVMLAVAWSGQRRVRVVSSDGESTREVPPTSLNDWNDGFLADGRVLIHGEGGSRGKLSIVSLAGGTPTRVALPDSVSPDHVTTDGKLAYWRNGPVRGVLDVAAGTSRIISRNVVRTGGEANGTRSSAQDEYLYVDRVNGRFELRAWSPVRSESRLVRAIPAAGIAVGSYHLKGDAAFWTETRGDSSTLYTASSSTQTPERVVSVRGRHSDGFSISHDGRRLAMAHGVINGSDTSHVVIFAELRANGSLAGPARVVSVPQYHSGVAWLPNNREVVFVGWLQGGAMARLMKLGVEEGARPQFMGPETGIDWDFTMSPDGLWIAYPVDLPGKSSIWRVDLPGLTANPSRH
jgi:Tol biopolymer transport system component